MKVTISRTTQNDFNGHYEMAVDTDIVFKRVGMPLVMLVRLKDSTEIGVCTRDQDGKLHTVSLTGLTVEETAELRKAFKYAVKLANGTIKVPGL